MSYKKKQEKPSFIGPFLRQFLDLSTSAGSVIGDAIGLFKTFQKIGSIKSFSVHFSEQCYQMFSWAINLVEIIKSALYVRPFSDIQKFYGYTFVIPLSIIMFISTVIVTVGVPYQLILLLLILMFGAGFGLIKINLIIAIVFISVPVVLLILSLTIGPFSRMLSKILIYSFGNIDLKKNKSEDENSDDEQESKEQSNENNKGKNENKKNNNDNNDDNEYYDSIIGFSISFLASFFIFSAVAFPLTFSSTRFTFFSMIIFSGIFIILLIIELILYWLDLNAILFNLLSFSISLISLAIIPSANAYIALIDPKLYYSKAIFKKFFAKNWEITLGYFACGICLPILLSFSSIYYDRQTLRGKYRKWKHSKKLSFNPLYFTEMIDTIKQIAFAIAAAINEPWVCVGIEIAWVLYVAIAHPYQSYSEYCLQVGSSFVVLMGNGLAIGYKNKGTIFSFKISVIIACVSCLPFIVGFYVYFFFEYEPYLKKIPSAKKRRMQKKKSSLLCIVVPILFFFYAFSIPKFVVLTFYS